jgi:polyisoprenoid-binding protein YceI
LRKISKASFIAASVILLGQLAQAQNRSIRVVLDPAQTEIHWKLSGLHPVHGTFKLKSGEFLFNPKTGTAEGEILVDATTGESGNAARDKRMQDEVLESNRYPAIFYHLTEIKGPFKAGEGTQDLTAEGAFNIHGADHPLELPIKVQISAGLFLSGPLAVKIDTVTATTRFTVPYVEWGMKNPSRLLRRVSKQVEIEVTAKGTIKQTE